MKSLTVEQLKADYSAWQSEDCPRDLQIDAAEDIARAFPVLAKALEESVKLQTHYAELLNICDGGRRIGFASADAWIDRLRECGTIGLVADLALRSDILDQSKETNRGMTQTICVDCKHHNGADQNQSLQWHVCLRPELKKPVALHPVTGRKLPGGSPPCSEVNKDGNCEWYEPKG